MRPIRTCLRESTAIRLFLGFALAALVLWAVGWLVTGPYKYLVAGFDSNIRYTMRQIQSPMWTALFLTVTKLGSTIYLSLIGVALGIVLIVLRRFRSLFFFIVAMVGQAALHHGFKFLFARPRPSALINYRTLESFSFPSGHAVAALSLYGMIAWIVTREIESPAVKAVVFIVASVLVLLIGISRVYIGVHHATDVVAGFLAASIWIGAVMSCDKEPP
jgi:undecaprenyl-diphosphatase